MNRALMLLHKDQTEAKVTNSPLLINQSINQSMSQRAEAPPEEFWEIYSLDLFIGPINSSLSLHAGPILQEKKENAEQQQKQHSSISVLQCSLYQHVLDCHL